MCKDIIETAPHPISILNEPLNIDSYYYLFVFTAMIIIYFKHHFIRLVLTVIAFVFNIAKLKNKSAVCMYLFVCKTEWL